MFTEITETITPSERRIEDPVVTDIVKNRRQRSRSHKIQKLERIQKNIQNFKKKTNHIEVEVTSCKQMLVNVMKKIEDERNRFKISTTKCNDLKSELAQMGNRIDHLVSKSSRMGSVLGPVDNQRAITHIPGGDKFSRGSRRSINRDSEHIVSRREIETQRMDQ